jgi:hypothetical protein
VLTPALTKERPDHSYAAPPLVRVLAILRGVCPLVIVASYCNRNVPVPTGGNCEVFVYYSRVAHYPVLRFGIRLILFREREEESHV